MKILITGAEGQLGKALIAKLNGREYWATDISMLDITNPDNTRALIVKYKPDVVIHTAAYTNVDAAEANLEMAFRVNALGTQHIAFACNDIGAKMLYVSTDYVFDGTKGRLYHEFDTPNPYSIYGKSKLAGEILAKQTLAKLFIARTAWLYGDGNNFVQTMLKLGSKNEEIRVVNDQYGCPTNADDLAEVLLKIIETDYYGIYHTVNNGYTTWFEFAKTIFSIINAKVEVIPINSTELNRPALRPQFAPLESNMLQLITGSQMRGWKEALTEYLDKIMNVNK